MALGFSVGMLPLLPLSLRLFLLYILVVFSLLNLTHAACYLPSGSVFEDDVPCDYSAIDSPCCFRGQACLSNKMCYDIKLNTYTRGTCTDKSWKGDGCPRFCLDQRETGNRIFHCDTTSSNLTSGAYCCNDDCSCTDPLAEVLPFGPAPSIVTVIGQTAGRPSASAASSASGANTAAAASASATGGNGGEGGGVSNGTAIGVGVGVGVAVAGVAAATAWFLVQRRRYRAAAAAAAVAGGGAEELRAQPESSNGAVSGVNQGVNSRDAKVASSPVHELGAVAEVAELEGRREERV